MNTQSFRNLMYSVLKYTAVVFIVSLPINVFTKSADWANSLLISCLYVKAASGFFGVCADIYINRHKL